MGATFTQVIGSGGVDIFTISGSRVRRRSLLVGPNNLVQVGMKETLKINGCVAVALELWAIA